VIISATVDAQRAATMLEADAALGKPFDLHEVFALVDRFCRDGHRDGHMDSTTRVSEGPSDGAVRRAASPYVASSTR
jgi:hypothetical protein